MRGPAAECWEVGQGRPWSSREKREDAGKKKETIRGTSRPLRRRAKDFGQKELGVKRS